MEKRLKNKGALIAIKLISKTEQLEDSFFFVVPQRLLLTATCHCYYGNIDKKYEHNYLKDMNVIIADDRLANGDFLTQIVIKIYLGIEQVFQKEGSKVTTRLRREYLKCDRTIWKSKLNSKHKVLATNSWAVAVYQYFFSGIRFARTPLLRLDKATWVEMRLQGAHYRVASKARLYLPRSEGGRGLKSLEHTWEHEAITSALYLQTSCCS